MAKQDLQDIIPGGVAVIIGENGSGKSTLLASLVKDYLHQSRTVIAIANTIHDKFNTKSKRFKLLSHRSGRSISLRTIKKAFANIANEDLVKFRRIGGILGYVGYERELAFKVNFHQNWEIVDLYESEGLSRDEYDDIQSLLRRLSNIESIDGVYWINLEDFLFDKVGGSTISRLLKHERFLKKHKIVKSLNIFLRKEGSTINLSQASSGELSFITSIIFISTEIDDNTVIMIDEPENSLHPNWQKEYISKLMDIFYLNSPAIVCATHSPIIISGAEITEKNLDVYKSENNTFEKIKSETSSVEQLLWDMFGITTPESNYLSIMIRKTLNLLAEKQISLKIAVNRLEELELGVYDDRQKTVLAAAKNLANQISNRD